MKKSPRSRAAFAAAFFVSVASTFGVFSVSAQAAENLGRVMYVGDSITHGVDTGSWRWAFHKILVDNGVGYESVGWQTKNYSGGIAVGTTYGGVAFNNVHSAQYNVRAYQVAGRSNVANVKDHSNIKNWLGQSTVMTDGKTYKGPTFDKIDRFYMLLGTNDLFSDSNDKVEWKDKLDNLLGNDCDAGDMGTIADAMFQNSPDAKLTVFSIPCWSTHWFNDTNGAHELVRNYNPKLQEWVKNYNAKNGKNIQYVDINRGLIDVASKMTFFGVASMFKNPGTERNISDGVHPNAQGDLIIAGNVAKAQGLGGRTAGRERKAAANFSTRVSGFSAGTLPSNVETENTGVDANGNLVFGGNNAGTSGKTSTLSATWGGGDDFSAGFTVEIDGLVVGDGATNGWDVTNNFQIRVGDGTNVGILNVNEAYIQWGETILFSADMSANADALRVAYVVGDATAGIDGGFYVWLDDMLIGEALEATIASGDAKDALWNGVLLDYAGAGTVEISGFAMTAGAFAPESGSAIPEPSEFGLLAGLGALALVASRRHRSRK